MRVNDMYHWNYRLFSTNLFPVHELPYHTLIFVDPTMCREEFWYRNLHTRKGLFDYGALATGSAGRRDRWISKEEAFSWFSNRFPWKTWDTRAVRSFVVSDVSLLSTKGGDNDIH